ncbi:MAG: energy transducer TonB [Burkholderiaceae bacterium]
MKTERPHPDESCGRPLQVAALLGVAGVHLLIVLALLASGSPRALSAETAPVMVQIQLAAAAESTPAPAVAAPESARRAPPPRPAAPPKPAKPTEPADAPQPDARASAPAATPVSEPAPPAASGPPVSPAALAAAQPAAASAAPPSVARAAPGIVSAAQYRRAPVLEYPSVSRRFGEEGRVLLRVLIGADGVAREVEVEQGSGYPRLDAAAIKAARGALYRPVMVDSQAQAGWARVPLNFSLKGQDS